MAGWSFQRDGLGKEPPHVYGTAEAAYQRLVKTRQSELDIAGALNVGMVSVIFPSCSWTCSTPPAP